MRELKTKLSLKKILESKNLLEDLDEHDIGWMGNNGLQGFNSDLNSRLEWETRMEEAMQMALQVTQEKTFPWPGASNVKFPLITIAAMQYHSRVYPALITPPSVVRCWVPSKDPQGEMAAAAERVGEHMSWQVLEEDECWEAETDRSLLVQAILGSVFKKTYFDGAEKKNKSECVLPSDLVVNYWTKSLDTSPMVTHVLYWSRNDFMERVRRGLIPEDKDMMESPRSDLAVDSPLSRLKDRAQGTQPGVQNQYNPYIVLEQHVWYDLDDDGVQEPYTQFVRYDNGKLLRLVARFYESGVIRNERDKIIRIDPESFFTKYPFIPSPDGGFYDLGLGSLLGPLSESIDSSINQLIDAGTMSNAGGGFLGRGFRMKSGDYSFRPNEWKRTDSPGDDIRKNIFPLPTKEPSAVLFSLCQLLINYGERIIIGTDALVGENPGQNTKAETMQSMVEQGSKVFNGIYKRTYRAMRDEFRKLFRLNTLYLDEKSSFASLVTGEQLTVLRADYALPATAIRPSADPIYMSDQQKMKNAMALRQAMVDSPGLLDPKKIGMYILQAAHVPSPEQFLAQPAPPPPPPVQLQVEQLRQQGRQLEMQVKMKLEVLKLMEQAELHRAQVVKLEMEAVMLAQQAATVRDDSRIAVINAEIGAAKLKHEGLMNTIQTIAKLIEVSNGVNNEGRDAPVEKGQGNGKVHVLSVPIPSGSDGSLGGGNFLQ